MSRLLLILAFFCLFPSLLHAELMVVQIGVNGVTRGEFFVEREATRRFLIPVAEIPALGLLITPQKLSTIGADSYFSLEEFPDIAAEFDDNQLALLLTAPAAYLPATTLDLSHALQRDVIRPQESSAFVNYRFDYDIDSRISGYTGGLATEVGLRRRNLLFLSAQRYDQTEEASRVTRLMTSATWEWRDEMRRFIIGDGVSPAGLLDPSVRFGGVTFSRNFALDPTFIQYPTFDYAGSVSAPVEIDIYQDGLKLRTETLPPGDFRLENFSGAPGYGAVELVVRDQFGRETRLQAPFYQSDQLLKPGLQEYSYSAGLLRSGFGSVGDRYGSAALFGMHRYGWKRRLTVGYTLQAKDGLFMAAPRLDLLAGTAGVVSVLAGGSAGDQGGGGAGLLRYAFSRRPFSARLEWQGFSQGWQTLSTTDTVAGAAQQQFSGAIGWGNQRVGSFSLDATQTRYYGGTSRLSLGTTYGRRLFKDVGFNLILRQIRDAGSHLFAFATFTYMPSSRLQTALRFEAQNGASSQTVEVQQQPPPGEGYGYLAAAGHRGGDPESAAFLAPSGEYRSRTLIVRGGGEIAQGDTGSTGSLSLSAAGALTWVGGRFHPSRPVDDSFALVRVGELSGVRVYRNGQDVGRTDSEGFVLIPGISAYYENHVSIEDTDIPIDHVLSRVDCYLSPPERSGSCVVFDVARSQPVTGRLYQDQRGVLAPLEYRQLELVDASGRSLTIPTGRGGEFYFDPRDFRVGTAAKPVSGCEALKRTKTATQTFQQRYQAAVWIDGRKADFFLDVPESDGIFIDLDQIVVDAGSGEEQGG